MRAVVQRVGQAWVEVEGRRISAIGPGLLVLLGVSQQDDQGAALGLAQKIAGLRIFADEDHKLNRSVAEVKGQVLVVSQFTLWADCRKGRRPSFGRAASGPQALELYEFFVKKLREQGLEVLTGSFGAMMDVGLLNQGPVTIMLDTQTDFC